VLCTTVLKGRSLCAFLKNIWVFIYTGPYVAMTLPYGQSLSETMWGIRGKTNEQMPTSVCEGKPKLKRPPSIDPQVRRNQTVKRRGVGRDPPSVIQTLNLRSSTHVRVRGKSSRGFIESGGLSESQNESPTERAYVHSKSVLSPPKPLAMKATWWCWACRRVGKE
jgi:hypothetical protein